VKIAIISNTSWYIYNFRQCLIDVLTQEGHEVVVIAPPDDYAARIQNIQKYYPWQLIGASKNPLVELSAFWNLRRHILDSGAEVILSYTPKANIYAAVIARLSGKKIIANIAGLGSAMISGGMLARLVIGLYRVALRRVNWVFFQNPDDAALFYERSLVRRDKSSLLPGSGVDLEKFSQQPLPNGETVVFLLVGRLLREKGVEEYIAAARILKHSGVSCRCQLLGHEVTTNPSAMTVDDLRPAKDAGVIEYLGSSDDVRSHIATADCVVLPSYREGTPRSLTEAAAMGRPLIATDVPGCRSVVEDGVTGLMCRVRDAEDLAAAMMKMVRFSPEQRQQMGLAGRQKMEREFDEHIVLDAYQTQLGLL
jgi:glycosyltransferase involved in cell wall biosynthesis